MYATEESSGMDQPDKGFKIVLGRLSNKVC